jgi:hypothetical protein
MFPGVPQVVPQDVPNSTSIPSHMVQLSCTLTEKVGKKCRIFYFYFVTGVQRGVSIGECPMFQKNWPINVPPSRKEKRRKSVITPMN